MLNTPVPIMAQLHQETSGAVGVGLDNAAAYRQVHTLIRALDYVMLVSI